MFICDELIQKSVEEAIRRWKEEDGDKHRSNCFRKFLADDLTEDKLNEVGSTFKLFISKGKGFYVARTLKAEHHKEIIQFCHETFSPSVRAGVNIDQTWETVDVLATQIQKRGWSAGGRRPISFSSKFATMVSPDFYAPYDKYAKLGLSAYCGAQNRRIIFNAGNYQEYMSAFSDFQEKFSHTYQISERTKEKVDKSDVRSVLMRVADKALMKIGGYARF